MSLGKIILFASTFIVLATACEADRCFKRVGNLVVDKIEYDSFQALHIQGIFDVELVQDTVYYVEIMAYEQVFNAVELKLNNDTLTCYNYNNCFWRSDFDRPFIRVHFPDITILNIFEASYIYSTDSITDDFQFTIRSNIAEADIIFNCKSVFFYINGTSGGRYIFRGKTDKAYLMNVNTGLFEMDELECKTAKVLNYSFIDMKVNVLEKLYVEIYNSGNIRYKGSPEVIYDTLTSSGRAIPMD